MKTRELSRQYARLQTLISKTQSITSGDIEAQSHWAKYLCVLSAGFLENALREVYRHYCANCSNAHVARFTGKALERIQNPKTATFLEVAESFLPKWKTDLEAFLDAEGRKEAINSIMANRHLIAHGKDSNISMVRVKEYLQRSAEVVEFIENQCGI